MKANKDLWIVIPAYNERKNVGNVIQGCKKFAKNVVLVDDGSKDNTYRVGLKQKVHTLQHPINLGKGAALKTGCDYAYLNGAEEIVVLDADGQHKPEEIPNFLKNLKGNDIVFGSRQLNKNMPKLFKFGNWGINKITEFLYSVKLRDTQSGFRAFTRKSYEKIRWDSCNYSMESEMIAKVGKHHLKYAEISIETIYLDKYKGTTIIDGLKIGLNLLLWRLKWY